MAIVVEALKAREALGGSSRNSNRDPGSQHSVAPRNPGSSTAGGNQSRLKPPGTFAIWIIAGAIALASIIAYGAMREGVFLGVILFLIFGSLFPPAGVIVGLVVLAAMFYRGAGTKVFDWLGGLSGKTSSPTTQAYAPLGPSVPGYQPPTSSSPFAPISKSVPGG